MSRQPEQWGGEVHIVPGWVRRLLRRPPPPGDSSERAHEARKEQPTVSVGENADRAVAGPLTEMYHEGRKNKKKKA
jgi:hypothetical protein